VTDRLNHKHYRVHDVPRRSDTPSPLGQCVGTTVASEEEVERLARKAYREGIFVFTRKMLQRMKPFERAIVEGLAKNFFGGEA